MFRFGTLNVGFSRTSGNDSSSSSNPNTQDYSTISNIATAVLLRRDFGKSNNWNVFQFWLTCLLFNLFTVKITFGYET